MVDLEKADPIMDQIDDLVFDLIKARKKAKMTQKELAELAGIPQPTIARIETFSCVPSLKTLVALANKLGFSLVMVKNDENG